MVRTYLLSAEVYRRHQRRAWPSRGDRSTLAARKAAMCEAIKCDLAELEQTFIAGGIPAVLTEMLRIVRHNTRHEIRQVTRDIAVALTSEWLAKCPQQFYLVNRWATPIANDAQAGVGFNFARMLLAIAAEAGKAAVLQTVPANDDDREETAASRQGYLF